MDMAAHLLSEYDFSIRLCFLGRPLVGYCEPGNVNEPMTANNYADERIFRVAGNNTAGYNGFITGRMLLLL